MVTGDNAQCGFYIAKECAMVAHHVQVLLADLNEAGRYMHVFHWSINPPALQSAWCHGTMSVQWVIFLQQKKMGNEILNAFDLSL